VVAGWVSFVAVVFLWLFAFSIHSQSHSIGNMRKIFDAGGLEYREKLVKQCMA
jgi:hypothetical protein